MMIGKTIGNYRLLSLIGKGGMGSVWLAEDIKLKRKVAVKLISEEIAANSEAVKRFKVEAIAQAKLNHPNIIQVFSFEDKGKLKYIAMEYIDGVSLKEIIKRKGKLPLDVAVEIFLKIVSAIEFAHKNGVIHRDIKPSNILLKGGIEPKIGDFGIAKVKGIEGITRAGSVLGTPFYSSPEQVSGKRVDERTDIYSLGILFYEMLTGKPPFVGERNSFVEIAEKQLKEKPLPPSQIVKTIPQDVDRLILKCLEKIKDKRYQKVEDLKKDLLKIQKKIKNGGRKFNISFKGKVLKLPAVRVDAEKVKIFFKRLSFLSYKGIVRKKFNDEKKGLILTLIILIFIIFILITILLNGSNRKSIYVPSKSYQNAGKKAEPLPEIIVKKSIVSSRNYLPEQYRQISKKQESLLNKYFEKKEYKKLLSFCEALIKKGYRSYWLYLSRARAYFYLKKYEKAFNYYFKTFKLFGKIEFLASFNGYDGRLVITKNILTFYPEKKKKDLKSAFNVFKKSKGKGVFKIKIKNVKIKVKKPYLLSKHQLIFYFKDKKYKVNLKAGKREHSVLVKKFIEKIKGGEE